MHQVRLSHLRLAPVLVYSADGALLVVVLEGDPAPAPNVPSFNETLVFDELPILKRVENNDEDTL